MINLVSVYREPKAKVFLYQMLQWRIEEPDTNISHKALPTLEEHEAFMASKPYHVWYLIVNEVGEWVGTVYLTRAREIGVRILQSHRRRGYARQAVQEVMRKWPGRFLAHINPTNTPSIALFVGLGARLIQSTYEL